ncbi:glycosyl transferase family protein [Psychrobacter sp. AntiMn-1]|uniref:glycosyltransferase n=1 Tax=Psychrobacter sp. AntiMn-1 TaxID=1720344 RepID=UPI0008A70E53|nr:glycosyltransferase [Psychrobacter sp. AntiMn-1]AOY44991.1 glycosyl transferase family protein [Psychrobacter sp. AntiMn-1]
MKRILHIVGKMDRAGAETMLMNLYRHIDRNKIQFDFVTFTDEVGDYDFEIQKLGGKIIPIIASNQIDRMLKLQKFLRSSPEYDIVHAHMSLSNAFHLLAAKNAGVKHRISHSHNSSGNTSNISRKVYEKWALLVNRKIANHKIACGELAANYLFGTTENVLLLQNAVDIEQMIEVAKNSRHYIADEFDDDKLKIIQVGRLIEVKNHKFSLGIAESLKEKQIDFTLYIIGDGPLNIALSKEIEDKSLSEKVKLLGLRTDITELMAGADYMIMPSLSEGFPVVLVESQVVGLTTIVSEKVSPEVDLGLELIDFLPINSVEEWVERLQQTRSLVCAEKEIMSKLSLAGFDVSENAKKITHFYTNLSS